MMYFFNFPNFSLGDVCLSGSGHCEESDQSIATSGCGNQIWDPTDQVKAASILTSLWINYSTSQTSNKPAAHNFYNISQQTPQDSCQILMGHNLLATSDVNRVSIPYTLMVHILVPTSPSCYFFEYATRK